MKALTAAEMREVDRLTTERFAISGQQLMEVAGKSIAEVFLELYVGKNGKPPGRVCVLCGKGNNGGDGLVVARHLKRRVGMLNVYLFAEPNDLRGDAATNYARWRELGETLTVIRGEEDWIRAWPDVAGSEVIVDALLGTGIRGGAGGLLAQVIENINRFSQDAKAAWPAWIIARGYAIRPAIGWRIRGRPSLAGTSHSNVHRAENWPTDFRGCVGLRCFGCARHRHARCSRRGSRQGKIALGRS